MCVRMEGMLLERETAIPAGPRAATRADPLRLTQREREVLGLICVLSGEIWLELDDGEIHLRPGDCVVQNGTRHAWRNRSGAPCSMAIVLIGASHAGHGPRDERR